MSQYDPNEFVLNQHEGWLVTALRAVKVYTQAYLGQHGDDLEVEMNFPDTVTMEKQLPLPKPLVHFALDNIEDPLLGFGTPGILVTNDYDDPANPTMGLVEAAQHILNFDVGVWVSSEAGGETKRMQIVQALKDGFARQGGRQAFRLGTGGLNILSFDGGRFALDRINDVPVWRAMDMTLLVRAFSRHAPISSWPAEFTVNVEGELVIQTGVDGDGEPILDPVVTP